MSTEIREQDLIAELDDIHTFVKCILDAVDKKNHSQLIITPVVYSRHIAVLFLAIECMRREIHAESFRTGEHKTMKHIDKWMEEHGLW